MPTDHVFVPEPWHGELCDAKLLNPDGRTRTCGQRKQEHEAPESGAATCGVCGRPLDTRPHGCWTRAATGYIDPDCYRLAYEREKARADQYTRDAYDQKAEFDDQLRTAQAMSAESARAEERRRVLQWVKSGSCGNPEGHTGAGTCEQCADCLDDALASGNAVEPPPLADPVLPAREILKRRGRELPSDEEQDATLEANLDSLLVPADARPMSAERIARALVVAVAHSDGDPGTILAAALRAHGAAAEARRDAEWREAVLAWRKKAMGQWPGTDGCCFWNTDGVSDDCGCDDCAPLRALLDDSLDRAAAGEATPIDVLLHCPVCQLRHVDAPEPGTDWTNPPHKSHKCHGCGTIWRPADVPTNGVATIGTRGAADTWASPSSAAERVPVK